MSVKETDRLTPEQLERQRIRNQTVEEWLQEYETGQKVFPSKLSATVTTLPKKPPSTRAFVFESFRTTRLSRLVMAFIDTMTGEEAVAFFNVDIQKQRGKGEHKIGESGQFYPKKKSKFRRLWKSVVKKDPHRWSRVHKEINSCFKDRLFTGQLKHKERSRGESYVELINITELGTEKAQKRHRKGTEKAQRRHRNGTGLSHRQLN